MSFDRPLYRHSQTGWLMLASSLIPFGALACVHAFDPVDARATAPFVWPFVAGLVALAIGFSWLTVSVTDADVRLRFGIGLYSRTIALDDVRDVAKTTSRWYEGWGIRWTRRGMLYNIGGFDAVALSLRDGKTVRIGSDDASRLAGSIGRALEARRARPRR